MRHRNFLLALFVFAAGCAPIPTDCSWLTARYHGFWLVDKHSLIGTRFDPSNKVRYSNLPQGRKHLYHIEQKSPNTRYYIQWQTNCRYSLLVDPDSTILSWRFEDTEDPCRSCIVR
jgi:hypothetical protein